MLNGQAVNALSITARLLFAKSKFSSKSFERSRLIKLNAALSNFPTLIKSEIYLSNNSKEKYVNTVFIAGITLF